MKRVNSKSRKFLSDTRIKVAVNSAVNSVQMFEHLEGRQMFSADLYFTGLTIPSSITAGNAFNVGVNIADGGGTDAGNSVLRMQIKDASGRTWVDQDVATPGVRAGSSIGLSTSASLPSTAPAGVYTAAFTLDRYSNVVQSNTGNDYAYGNINVTAQAVAKQDQTPPSAMLIDPVNGTSISATTLNVRKYIDINVTDAGGSGLNVATVLGSGRKILVTGTGANGVAIGTPTQVGTSTFRLPFTGNFTTGSVSLNIAAGAFADNSGNSNAAINQTFTVSSTGLATDTNVNMLATIITSEAGGYNPTERLAVGSCVMNRMTQHGWTNVATVLGANGNQFAHGKKPTSDNLILARNLLTGTATPIANIVNFYSPISMPKEDDSVKGFDVAGGLEQVDGLAQRNWRPSWALTMTYVEIASVRPKYFKFFA